MEKNYFKINLRVHDSRKRKSYTDFRVTELPKYVNVDVNDVVKFESDFTDELEASLGSGEYIEEVSSVEEISKDEYTKYI
jgi:hypothetical protein